MTCKATPTTINNNAAEIGNPIITLLLGCAFAVTTEMTLLYVVSPQKNTAVIAVFAMALTILWTATFMGTLAYITKLARDVAKRIEDKS